MFSKSYRKVNTGKTSVFLNSLAFAVRENARKLLKTQEHTISVRLPNGERWKICVFLNSLEFTFLGKYRKTGMHHAFLTLTKR